MNKTDNFSDKEGMGLLVFDIMGYCMGLNTTQVLGIREPAAGDDENKGIIWFHALVPMKGPVHYQSPKVVLIRNQSLDQKQDAGIIIDRPNDILAAEDCKIVRPMPRLIREGCGNSPLQGVMLVKERMIFIVDCYKFLNIPDP